MATVKKIYVNKSDEVTTVVERLIDADADEVVLSIPKFSKLAESTSNFHLLRREAEVLKKKIVVESVDDAVLAICRKQNIECVNPFFAQSPRRMADIMPREEKTKDRKREHEREREAEAVRSMIKGEAVPPASAREEKKPKRAGYRLPFGRRMRVGAIALAALVILLGVGGTVFRKAHIILTRATAAWKYDETIAVDTGIAAVDAAGKKIPGQLFSDTKNVTLSFPATGRKNAERRAQGAIVIYNAFGPQPQLLVARTRFVTPEGKVFRLTNAVTVPGAKTANGKLAPSSVDARVIADGTGPSYNVGPISRFTIPGFAGTPKANTFYAESKSAMAGGATGETAYPTEEDITRAKENSTHTLQNALHTLLVGQVPADLKLLKNAELIRITKQSVMPEVDAHDQFSVSVEGEISLMMFREADVRTLLLLRMQSEVGNTFEPTRYTLNYHEDGVRREKNKLLVPISYESTVARAIDLSALKNQIAGKGEREIRELLFNTPGLASARVSLWPFWVRTVPHPSKIELEVK